MWRKGHCLCVCASWYLETTLPCCSQDTKQFLKHKSYEFLVGILGITEVIGSISGTINRKDIGSVALMAEISYVDQFVVIKLDVKNIPKPLLYIMRSVVSFLVPVYWSVVNQGEDGFNGISIALGKFTYNGKVINTIVLTCLFILEFNYIAIKSFNSNACVASFLDLFCFLVMLKFSKFLP